MQYNDPVHIIAKRTLRQFWEEHPEAEAPMSDWHSKLAKAKPASFAEVKQTFGSADWVQGYVVFDVGGNKFRIVADLVFQSQTAFIKQVMTHKEYDQWKP